MTTLFGLWNCIQQYLLPHTEENIGSLTDKGAEFVRVAELARVDRHLMPSCVRVRGAARVISHLMFGVIALTAKQLFRLLE